MPLRHFFHPFLPLDIKDWKYSGSESAGSHAVRVFLEQNGCNQDVVEQVIYIIDNIGFKTELGQADKTIMLTPELAVVQDADRLDAIGAIGMSFQPIGHYFLTFFGIIRCGSGVHLRWKSKQNHL